MFFRYIFSTVFLDTDKVRMPEAKLENGCLRLLFKCATGSLFTFNTAINSTDLADFDSEDKEVQEAVLPSPPFIGFLLARKNPFIVKGNEKPHEMKFTTRNHLYIRLDLPDVFPGQEVVGFQDDDTTLLHGTEEVGHSLLGQFVLGCGCCRLGLPRHEMKNGELRMMVPKIKNGPICYCDIRNLNLS